jgi:hypothetical protein
MINVENINIKTGLQILQEAHPNITKALSVKQPWAWLIANGNKDIENRTWKTNFRGEFFIHAGLTSDKLAFDFLAQKMKGQRIPSIASLPYGGIVGIARLVDCIQDSKSIWAEPGLFHFVIENACPIDFVSCPGKQKFFEPWHTN